MLKYVVIYLIDEITSEVYYLKKNRPRMKSIHNKLVGWGGKIENNETPIQASIREVKEELNLDLLENKIVKQGEFYDEIGEYISVCKYYLNNRLKEGLIENEGIASYKPKYYHKLHPEEFPEINLQFQDLILFSDKKFKLDFRK